MPNQDTRTKSAYLREVTQWLLKDIHWNKELHPGCTWTFSCLTTTALFWVWSAEKTLKERFFCAQRITIWLNEKKIATSMQAFVEILVRHTEYLRNQLLLACRKRMGSFSQWKTNGYIVFGMDGSEFAVPRTQSNQTAFTTNGKSKRQRRKKKKSKQIDKLRSNPRILMTTLFHCALGLPWDWRLGSKSDNERSQLLEMLPSLPKHALIVGDAGFVGYDFLSAILANSTDLIVRVGSNVKLLKQLGYVRQSANTVYIWPASAARKKQLPLVLRQVVINDGKKPIYLVTTVLSNRLSPNQIAKIYRDRWGIELYHRHVKQTLDRRKMLSRKAENAFVELEWTILGFLAMTLYACHEFNRQHLPLSLMSPAGVIRAFQRTLHDYMHQHEKRNTLRKLIVAAVKDTYKRNSNKSSRDYPRKRKHKSPGKPLIKIANKTQIQLAKELRKQSLAA